MTQATEGHGETLTSEEHDALDALVAKPKLLVRVLVVKDGIHAQCWDKAMTILVLQAAQRRTAGVFWELVAYHEIEDPGLYLKPLPELLTWAEARVREPGYLTLVVGRYGVLGAVGSSRLGYATDPVIVLRGLGEGVAYGLIVPTARLLLYHLGRCMGLRGSGIEQCLGALTRMDYLGTAEGRECVVAYARALEEAGCLGGEA